MHVVVTTLLRFSARRFLRIPVGRQPVEHILRVAARAPSGHNAQPRKVYAVSGEVRERPCAEIREAGEQELDQDQQEYEYYPNERHEPHLGRRQREVGYALCEKPGVAREDKEARLARVNRNHGLFDAPVGLFVTLKRRMNSGS